jgi:hypothetical protein
MTPKQITIIVLMGFIICIVGAFAIYRLLYPLNINPDDILYIVQPGLNYGNQLGMVFVVVCIVGFFLTFYIPVATNWNKEKCNDGMMFLAPLFDKNANKTLRDCAQRTLVQTSGKLENSDSYKVPDSVSTQIQSIVNFINEKIQAIKTSMSTADNSLLTNRLRDRLSEVQTDHKIINDINTLNGQIKERKKEIKKLKKTVDDASKAHSKADKQRVKQDNYIEKRGNAASHSDTLKRVSLTRQQKSKKTYWENNTNLYNAEIKQLIKDETKLKELGSLKTMKRELKKDIKNARRAIK